MQIPNEKSLTTQNQNLAVDVPAEFADLFNVQDNISGIVKPRLPQIGILHTAQLFKFDEETKIPKFEAIILHQNAANAWWERPLAPGEPPKMPDCFSMDGKTPVAQCEPEQNNIMCCENRQSDYCVKDGMPYCKQNQFGSDEKTGKGKACKNMKRLLILIENNMLPKRLTITPTSIRNFEDYMTGLLDRGLPYNTVVTEFSLEEKRDGTNVYSIINFKRKDVLKREDLINLAKFVKEARDLANIQEIRSDEYMAPETETNQETTNEPTSDIPF